MTTTKMSKPPQLSTCKVSGSLQHEREEWEKQLSSSNDKK
jgi:hypothetical protein